MSEFSPPNDKNIKRTIGAGAVGALGIGAAEVFLGNEPATILAAIDEPMMLLGLFYAQRNQLSDMWSNLKERNLPEKWKRKAGLTGLAFGATVFAFKVPEVGAFVNPALGSVLGGTLYNKWETRRARSAAEQSTGLSIPPDSLGVTMSTNPGMRVYTSEDRAIFYDEKNGIKAS